MSKYNIEGANSILSGWDYDIRYSPDGELGIYYFEDNEPIMPLSAIIEVADVFRLLKDAPADGWRSIKPITASTD